MVGAEDVEDVVLHESSRTALPHAKSTSIVKLEASKAEGTTWPGPGSQRVPSAWRTIVPTEDVEQLLAVQRLPVSREPERLRRAPTAARRSAGSGA